MVSASPLRMKRDAATCAAVSELSTIQNWLRRDNERHPGLILEPEWGSGGGMEVTLVTIICLPLGRSLCRPSDPVESCLRTGGAPGPPYSVAGAHVLSIRVK